MLFTFKVRVAFPEQAAEVTYRITTEAGDEQAARDQVDALVEWGDLINLEMQFESRERGTLYE
jgi:hypothetical protein